MAGTYTLGTLNLYDSASYWVQPPGVQIEAPRTIWQESERLRGVSRQSRVRTTGLRSITIPMRVYGATAAALRTNLDTLRAECQKTSNTLTLQHDGDTSSLAYTCVRQTQPSVPWDIMYELSHNARFDLILTCEPFAYGTEVTLFSATSKAMPATMDLTAMVGDYAAPLEITVASPSENIHCLYAGLIPDLTYTPYAEAEALTWAGGTTSDVVNAAAHGGYVGRNTSTTVAVATYADTAGYLPGTYLPLVRGMVSANSLQAGYGYGGTEYDAVAIATTYLSVEELTRIALPIVETGTGTAANLQVRQAQVVSGNGDTDWWGLLPLTWGWAAWHHATPASDTTGLVLGYDGSWYAAGVADYANGHGSALEADRTMRLVLFGDDANGTEDSLTANITIKYVPRYAQ